MAGPPRWHTKRPTAADAARRKQYDSPEYRATRKALKAEHTAGRAFCWRCGQHIPPSAPRDTGHDDYDRSVIRGNECRPCNRGQAAHKAALINNAQRKTRTRSTSRTWR